MRSALVRLSCTCGQTTAEYLGLLVVVAVIIAAVANSGTERVIVAGLQRAVCEVAMVSESECGSPAGQTGGRPVQEGQEGSARPAAPRLHLGEARRAAARTTAPAVLRPATASATGGTTCFASSHRDCGPGGEPEAPLLVEPPESPSPSAGDQLWSALVEGTAELSGFNDADDSVDALGDGELGPALLSGLLASPFGKIPKAGGGLIDGGRALIRRFSKEERERAAKRRQLRANQRAGARAERRLEQSFPGSRTQVNVQTSAGKRRIDVLTPNRVAIESKVGRVSLRDPEIRRQIAKDVELRRSSAARIRSVEWRFSSNAAGEIGPTKPLERELRKAGIKIVYDP